MAAVSGTSSRDPGLHGGQRRGPDVVRSGRHRAARPAATLPRRLLAHVSRLRPDMAGAGRHPLVPMASQGGGQRVNRHNAAGRSSRSVVMVAQNILVTFAVIGDRTAAVVARDQLPGLVAGPQALLAQHAPDANGHCRQCRAGHWRRRAPVPCRLLLKFQLARDDAAHRRPLHRLRRNSKQLA